MRYLLLALSLVTCSPAFAELPTTQSIRIHGADNQELATIKADGKVKMAVPLTADALGQMCRAVAKTPPQLPRGAFVTQDLVYRGPPGELVAIPNSQIITTGPAMLPVSLDVPWFAAVSPTSPPTRPTINSLDVTEVLLKAGPLVITVEGKNGANVIQTVTITVRNGGCSGYAYGSGATAGALVPAERSDGTITQVAAMNAFLNQAGAFGAKADALAAYLQSKSCLPN